MLIFEENTIFGLKLLKNGRTKVYKCGPVSRKPMQPNFERKFFLLVVFYWIPIFRIVKCAIYLFLFLFSRVFNEFLSYKLYKLFVDRINCFGQSSVHVFYFRFVVLFSTSSHPSEIFEIFVCIGKKLPASCLRKQFYRNKAPQT